MYKPPLVIAALLFAGSASGQIQNTLTYDSTTGSLSIDTQGQVLYTYEIILPIATPISGGFIQENHTQLPGNASSASVVSQDLRLADTNLTGWTNPSANSIGNVLPTDLSESEYETAFSEAYYIDQFGSKAFFDFELNYVPEPTSFILLAAGGVLLGYRRGRRDDGR